MKFEVEFHNRARAALALVLLFLAALSLAGCKDESAATNTKPQPSTEIKTPDGTTLHN